MERKNASAAGSYQGYLIARERLRSNWSQEGLCKGICTVSYLSKIESGKAAASSEILGLLLQRLGLQYDAALAQQAERIAEEGYELLFSFRMAALAKLMEQHDLHRFRATPAGLDLELLDAAAHTNAPLPPALEACMDARALSLQRVLQNRSDEAVLLYPNAYTYLMAGTSAYEAGRYAKALDDFRTSYELAARDGFVRIMLQCKVLSGNSYCNERDLENMERCYRIARRIAQELDDRQMLRMIDYNTASSWIEAGRYEDAYRWFSTVRQPDLMCLHKLAICCEKTQRVSEGFAALRQAETMDAGERAPDLAEKMLLLVRYRLEHPDYLEHEAYGALLLECFARCRSALPAGYASFHLPWVLEWYKATRQYKKACELLEDFPAKTI